MFGLGSIPAVKQALERAGWDIGLCRDHNRGCSREFLVRFLLPAFHPLQPRRALSTMPGAFRSMFASDWGDHFAFVPIRNEKRRFLMDTPQKVAVITGSSRGIGAALVKAYRGRNCGRKRAFG